MLGLNKDSIAGTIVSATLVCLVCSIFVAASAVVLKPQQVANKKLDKQINVLNVSGLYHSGVDVEEAFSKFEQKAVDLDTGEYLEGVDTSTFDIKKASRDPAMSSEIENDIAGIKRRPNYQVVYLYKEDNELQRIILPIHGYGLWSTLYGFLALEGDANTVYGISFYEHAETPGLGGEVDNPKWRSVWKGKLAYNDEGEPALGLVKGQVDASTPNAEHKVDGLAGATLTANGVTNMVTYWLGDQGYGPYLKRMQGE